MGFYLLFKPSQFRCYIPAGSKICKGGTDNMLCVSLIKRCQGLFSECLLGIEKHLTLRKKDDFCQSIAIFKYSC